MSINTKKQKMFKVSVLMPVYKTPEKYLREAIESILQQTFTDFEFLILDDCPQQLSDKIVKSYKDKRIKYIQNSENMGIAKSRNKLLDLAQGEYIAVMDHDDIALPERLAKEVEFLDTHPEVGVVGTWYEKFPKTEIKKKFVTNSQIERDLMCNCSILHPSAMIRKSVLEQNNIFYKSEFSPAEDYALWCSLIGKTKFANIPEVLQKYRDYENNTSKTQKQKMKASSKKISICLQKKYSELYKKANRCDKVLSFLGIPLITRRQKGNVVQYIYFGIIKKRKKEPIIMIDTSKLPIYIINFNRLSYLQKIISRLESCGLCNIHIIDNASTYPPMIEYLKQTPYTVHYMKNNYGHNVFFADDEFKQVRENEYYVLTDPDVIAIEECPDDFMDFFYQILQTYPQFNKVGFSLKTDDITGSSEAKKLLIKRENLFYKKRLNHFSPYIYASAIDTTFALYRPQKDWKNKDFYKAVRVGYPYQARHLPWYNNLHNLSDEEVYYNQRDCGSGNWNSLSGLSRIRECLISKTVDHWWENIFSVKKTYRRTIIRIAGIKFTHNHEMRGD